MPVSSVPAVSWRLRTLAGSICSIAPATPEESMMSSMTASGTLTAVTGRCR
jgi:hypothetical protein